MFNPRGLDDIETPIPILVKTWAGQGGYRDDGPDLGCLAFGERAEECHSL